MRKYVILCLIILITFILIISYFSNNNETFEDNLLNKVLVIQYDDRKNIPQNLNKLLKINNKLISEDKTADYLFINEPSNDLPPYWKKVKLVSELLETKNYKYVMWLDTDATIVNLKEELLNFIENLIKNKDMLISNDMPPWSNDNFNAGVWVVKNTTKGVEIMDEWLKYYRKDLWNITNGKWSCKNCIWAKYPGYEQGVFQEKIFNKYKNNIKQVNWKYLNNPYYKKNDKEVINHFANHYKNEINKI
jgi:hypothetical protein